MADDATRLKLIADNLEATYQSMRRAASSIAGLLQIGKATCDEVRAYNLWALSIYNTQRGMLATLRAGGEQGVPELPTAPTLFAWKGQAGADAWKVSCSAQPSSLSGIMKRALSGPDANSVFLSTNDIEIVTQDQFAYNPEEAPSFKTLAAVQAGREPQQMAGLGLVGILIAIAGIAIAVSVAIAAIMHYLEVSEVQEANTEQVRLQSQAFATYTAARLECYRSCTASGVSGEECIARCSKLVTAPKITLPGQDTKWGVLQWIGFTVVAGAGATLAWHAYQRNKRGESLFKLPDSVDAALHGTPDVKLIKRVAQLISYDVSKQDIREQLVADGYDDNDIFQAHQAAKVYLRRREIPDASY